MKNQKFYAELHARGVTTAKLAQWVGTGRAHLTQVLNNVKGRGRETRRRLFPYLTPTEISALGWSREYNRWLVWRRQARRLLQQEGIDLVPGIESEDVSERGNRVRRLTPRTSKKGSTGNIVPPLTGKLATARRAH